MVKDTEELKKHFNAYVKKAVENNSYKYLNKRRKVTDAETLYDNYEDLPKLNTEELLQQIDRISECFAEGVNEIKILLDQVEDYNLYAAITGLSDFYKKIISLRILNEKTFAEIGDIMGIAEKKAENAYYDALKKIRRILGGKSNGI